MLKLPYRKLVLLSVSLAISLSLFHFSYPVTPKYFFYIKLVNRVFLFMIAILYLTVNGGLVVLKNSSVFYYLIYLTIALLSLLYSVDISMSASSFFDLVTYLVIALFLYKLAFRSGVQIIELFFIVQTSFMAMFWVVGLTIYPFLYRAMGFGGAERLGGYLVNPNIFGCLCVSYIITLLYCEVENKDLGRKICKWILIAFVTWMLIQSVSRTALASMVVCISVYIFYQFLSKKKVFIYSFIGVVIAALFMSSKIDIILPYFQRSEGWSEVLSGTGRLDIWLSIINQDQSLFSILFGFGYQNIYKETYETLAAMAHNNVLQLFMGVGAIGLVVAISIFCAIFKEIKSFQSKQESISKFLKIQLVNIVIFSTVEVGVFGPNNVFNILFVLILCYLSQYRQLEQDRNEKITCK